MKINTIKMIELQDWNEAVQDAYGRPYDLQQQDGCMSRQLLWFDVPPFCPSDFENTTIPEIVNGPEMGVSFEAWKERDPEKPLVNQEYDGQLSLWWERNFYPEFETVVNDLYRQGLISEGQYCINIDW